MKTHHHLTHVIALAAALILPPAHGDDIKMAGYMSVNAEFPPPNYNSGFSMYVAAWPMLNRYPGHETQTGLFGTWMFPEQETKMPKEMYTTIEGGLGWWRQTHFPTATPKFLIGAVAAEFCEIANGPSQGAGSWNDPKGLYGVAQLSPWLLFPLDGLNLKQGTRGELFGYGYLPLPLIPAKKITAGKDIPTGDQSWTLFLNTKNFKGPVCFITPYFWSHCTLNHPEWVGHQLDARPSNPIKNIALECQYVPAALETNAKQEAYARIAPVSFPLNLNDESVVMHRMTCYTRQALWDGLKKWFDGGPPITGAFDPKGSFVMNFQASEGSSWGIRPEDAKGDNRVLINWNSFAKASVTDPSTYCYKWDTTIVKPFASAKGGAVTLPEYFRLVRENGREEWVNTTADKVPDGLRNVSFDHPEEEPQKPYDTPTDSGSSFKSPGPVAGPFKVRLGDKSILTYSWYRFADQPAMLNADLSKPEREELQKKVEKLHRTWKRNLNYIAPPTVGKLAEIDPALIVRPPKGFEIGYVPIATYQELDPSLPTPSVAPDTKHK
jgi:hypothetical protein